MGGVDMNLGKIASGMQGFEAWNQNAKIWNSKQKNINDAAVQMRVAYSAGKSGDKDAMETYRNLLSGKDSLHVGYTGGNVRTIKNTDGGRSIYLSSLGTDKNSKLVSGVTLVHEAHRDGVVDENNEMETRESVGAYTIAALGLSGTYGMGFIKGNENLQNDIAAFTRGPKAFAKYVDKTYDSSSDNWKVVLDENGEVSKVLDDGDKETITFVDKDGNIKSINRVQGSLSGQISEITALFQSGDDKQSKSDINGIMMASDLGYDSSLGGWYAKSGAAKDFGSGYDPLYDAIRNQNYSELPNILSDLGKNSQTDISQEMVEDALGLKRHSACAITASSEMENNFLNSLYGESLNSQELIEAISNAQGEMFNDESWVQSFNGINANIASELGFDNYLIKTGEYDSLEAMQADGINFYLEKHKDVNDPDHTHFTSWSNGYWDDTDTTTDYRWWEKDNLSLSVYYGFKPKY